LILYLFIQKKCHLDIAQRKGNKIKMNSRVVINGCYCGWVERKAPLQFPPHFVTIFICANSSFPQRYKKTPSLSDKKI
jgi:hypothetical protein